MPRLPPVAVVLVVAAGMWALARAVTVGSFPSAGARLVAMLAALAGAAIAIAGVVEFRRVRTTVDPRRPEKASALVRGGVYRCTRNPMYLGLLLVLIGWGLWLGSLPALLAGPALFVVWMNRGQIRAEEAALERAFGAEYRAFAASVPRWCRPFPPASSARAAGGWRLAARAGAYYFALVFATGFVLGALRVTVLVPRLGTRTAELAEVPVMLAVTLFAARWVARRLSVPPSARPRLGMGCVALVLLLVAEFGLVLPLRGLTLAEYLATRDPVSSAAYYASLVVLALAPWLLARCGSGTAGAAP